MCSVTAIPLKEHSNQVCTSMGEDRQVGPTLLRKRDPSQRQMSPPICFSTRIVTVEVSVVPRVSPLLCSPQTQDVAWCHPN